MEHLLITTKCGNYGLTLNATHPFYGDVVVVCADCEGWQRNSEVRTSGIGVSIMDTRDLNGVAVQDWKHKVHTFHLGTKDAASTVTMLNTSWTLLTDA